MSNLIGQIYRLNAVDKEERCDCHERAVWAIKPSAPPGKAFASQYACAYCLASTIRDLAALLLGTAIYRPEL